MRDKSNKMITILRHLSAGWGIVSLIVITIGLFCFSRLDDRIYYRSGSDTDKTYVKKGSLPYRQTLLEESRKWLKNYRNDSNISNRVNAFQTVQNGLIRLGIEPDEEENRRYFSAWQRERILCSTDHTDSYDQGNGLKSFPTDAVTQLLSLSEETADSAVLAAVEFLQSIETDGNASKQGDVLFLASLTNDIKPQSRNPLNRFVQLDPTVAVSFSPGQLRDEARMTFAGYSAFLSFLFGILGMFSPDVPCSFLTDARQLILLFFERLSAFLSILLPRPAFIPFNRLYRYDHICFTDYPTDLDTVRLLN